MPGVCPEAVGAQGRVKPVNRRDESEDFQGLSCILKNEFKLAEHKRKKTMKKKKGESGVGTAVQAERTACSEACRCEVACWV